jgi:acetyl esterase/lipase
MTVVPYLLSFLALAMSALYFLRVRSLTGIVLWMPKALAGSAAAFVALIGALGAALGLRFKARLAIPAGVVAVVLSLRYVLRVTAPHDGFERAFGTDWEGQIPPELRARMLKRRWMWRIPPSKGVRWERDIVFWTVPPPAYPGTNGADRELLCDIWRPPEGVRPSGLAFIYLHGGAWHWMDKDFGTRPFFRHLAAQGHVVMDVAYRLCPEVDIYGMVGDVKRAIAWMKANATVYAVDPARVVVGGASTGGHLALLAAYAPDGAETLARTGNRGLTPADIGDTDTSVRAVVAYYAGTDMHAFYRHFDGTFGNLTKGLKPGEGGILIKITGAMSTLAMRESSEPTQAPGFSIDWMMGNLLGGTPDQVPGVYDMASPITHAGPDSPPTLFLQGEHDSFQPARLSRAFHNRLVEAGVPSVYVEFAGTEHGFDMLLPRYAPAAQAALYDVDRFLALMV